MSLRSPRQTRFASASSGSFETKCERSLQAENAKSNGDNSQRLLPSSPVMSEPSPLLCTHALTSRSSRSHRSFG
jgi:hypothetical protein